MISDLTRSHPARFTQPLAHWLPRVAISYEGSDYGGDFGLSFAKGFEAHGCTIAWVERRQGLPPDADLVLAYGPFKLSSSMLPIGRQLASLPSHQRPVFVWWLTEGIPDPRMPPPLVQVLSRLRLGFDRMLPYRVEQGNQVLSRPERWLRAGHRLRVYGELRWLKEHGVLDVLAVTSESRARYLQARGLDCMVVPLGYDQHYGTDLQLPRDIAVCFLGNIRASRRYQFLSGVVDQLKAHGIAVQVQTNLYGDARTQYLNRVRIMLNILRAPQDFVGQRFLLAAANKVLIVSEPIADSAPFVPGRHIVVAPYTELADTIIHYLTHPAERQQIVDEAYRLATEEMTITKMVARILERASHVYAARITAL